MEARYFTLNALRELSPSGSHVRVYRVRTRPQYDEYGRTLYIRRRFVAFNDQHGGHLCSCMKGTHTGIPCRHFFAVLRLVPTEGFSLRDVASRWVQPPLRDYIDSRPVVYLNHLPAVHPIPETAVRSPNLSPSINLPTTPPVSMNPPATLAPKSPTPTTPATPAKGHKRQCDSTSVAPVNTPSSSPDKRLYVEMVNAAAELARMKPSPSKRRKVLEAIHGTRKEIIEEAAVVQAANASSVRDVEPVATPTRTSIDPVKFPRRGRKQTARVKASSEGRKRRPPRREAAKANPYIKSWVSRR